jgi:hypothetical protein
MFDPAIGDAEADDGSLVSSRSAPTPGVKARGGDFALTVTVISRGRRSVVSARRRTAQLECRHTPPPGQVLEGAPPDTSPYV